MGTNSTGDPRKLEENVRDDGSVTLLRVAKGRHSEVSTRNGTRKDHTDTRENRKEDQEGMKKPMMGKNKKHNRLTTTFTTTSNEADNSSE